MKQLRIAKQITNREALSLDLYLQEIGRLTMLNAEEEMIIARQINQGNQKALEKLVMANLRFVVSVAKQYQNQGLILPDLINEGNLGLIKAAGRFDETRGFKFISYAVWWIRQAIMQAIAENSRIVRIPMNKIGSIVKINNAFAKLEQDFQREPMPEEIAKMLKFQTKIVRDALMTPNYHLSTDAVIGESENNDFTLYDVLSINEPDPDNVLINNSLKIEIERTLRTLSIREASILRSLYGLGGEHSLTVSEIAEKIGITSERVRQLREKALKKLKNIKRNRLLRTYLG